MEIGKTLYVTDRKKWREWLKNHHNKEKEIWLIYFKKASGKPRIAYNDAVEEALCFGWIDSTVKSMDEERFAQRFTPRRKNSVLSEMNKERIRRLIKEKKMTVHGLKAVSHVYDDEFEIPNDVLGAIKNNKEAWDNFRKFPDSYKRIRIAYIESQRHHSEEAFRKSLNYFIKMTVKNKKFGMLR